MFSFSVFLSFLKFLTQTSGLPKSNTYNLFPWYSRVHIPAVSCTILCSRAHSWSWQQRMPLQSDSGFCHLLQWLTLGSAIIVAWSSTGLPTESKPFSVSQNFHVLSSLESLLQRFISPWQAWSRLTQQSDTTCHQERISSQLRAWAERRTVPCLSPCSMS